VCTAEAATVPIGLEAQRRLCLGIPRDCERFRSAEEARRAVAPLWPSRPIARTAPVVIDRGRRPIGVPHVAERRTLGQAALALVMVLAGAALIVARTGGPGAAGIGAVQTLTPTVRSSPSPLPSLAPNPTPIPPPTPGATASPKPTRTPKPSATPAATRTYRVRSGDTLSSIAARLGTTVKILRELNGISDPSLIRTGQVLKIP
jgi:LysM repeat protein